MDIVFFSTGEALPTNVGLGQGKESGVPDVSSDESLCKIKIANEGYQLPHK